MVIADIIARKLSCEFDIIISRNFAHLIIGELAIGAIVNGTSYLNESIITELKIPTDYIEQEKLHQLEEIKRMVTLYRI